MFTGNDLNQIAHSVLTSARRGHTRKSSPYRAAMSMINFYINRCGKGLSASKKAMQERTKDALRCIAGEDKGDPAGHGRSHARHRARSY